PASPLAHSLQLGERGPLWDSASGKAILAGLCPPERDQCLKTLPRLAATAATDTSLERMRNELARTARRGVAVARDSVILGVTAFAAAVFDANARPVAALSIALQSARVTSSLEKRVVDALLPAAAEISRRLGYRGPLDVARQRPDALIADTSAAARRAPRGNPGREQAATGPGRAATARAK
ncbi:MAG: hypothetical protein H7125_02550, partial [Proteobacteria bacterium]|nr:hypothetical protein [Burkholderiales bacterium]